MDKTLIRNEEVNLLSRLERIPITKTVVRIIALLASVWIIEAFDIGIVGQVILVLRKIWTLSPGDVGLLGTSSTIGIVIGLYFAGPFIDRFGRKKVLIWGVTAFSLFTLVGAAFPNIYWIVAMRFAAGLGEGAVFPLPYLMISEFVGARRRATLVSSANAILCAAYVVPSIVGAWALGQFPMETAWRIPFLVGGIPILTVIFFAKWLPESPRWLLQRGRASEVRQLVETLEGEAKIAHDKDYIDASILNSMTVSGAEKAGSVVALFKTPYLSRSLISWALYLATIMFWYVMLVYGATMFAGKGFAFGSAVMFAGIMTVIGGFGEVLIGHLSDGYGRKPVYLIFSIFAALGCAMMAIGDVMTVLIIGAFLAAFFGFGTLPCAKIYIAEQYPTHLRGVGSSVGESAARLLGGVFAAYYIPFILDAGGVNAVFWFSGIMFIVVVIPFMIWGRETAKLSVEETGASGTSEKTTEGKRNLEIVVPEGGPS